MKKINVLVAMALCSTALMAEPQNGTVFVKVGGTGDGSSWANAMGDIQAAIVAARADDAARKDVWVAGGTYALTAQIAPSDSINLYGSFAGTETSLSQRTSLDKPWIFANPTVLDGQNTTSCVVAGSPMDMPIVIDGFTAINGQSTNNGGVRLNLNVTLQNCIVRNCTSTVNAGGGVQIYPAGNVNACLIKDNKQSIGANGGGGISGNTSSSGYNIYIENSEICGNVSSMRGGAINIQGSTPSYITNCKIYNNMAIDGTTLKGGGAIYDNGANVVEITNCALFNNTGASSVYLKTGKFINNTIVKNVGAVYLASGSGASEVINNLVWGCATDDTGTTPTSMGGVTVNGMIVHNNATYNPIAEDKSWNIADNFQFSSNVSNGDVPDYEFGIGSGPKFVKTTSFIGAILAGLTADEKAIFEAELDSTDWSLNIASPCVNAGQDNTTVTTDITGASRPQGAKYDIGAYELAYFPVAIANYDVAGGAIYDEMGTELIDTTVTFAKNTEAVFYFLANTSTPLRKASIVRSTDGGLSFTGEETDITASIEADGKWTYKITFPFQIKVEWTPTALPSLNADRISCFGTQGSIVLCGLNQGEAARVYHVSGSFVGNYVASSTRLSIAAAPGAYIVRVGDAATKVIVK